MNDKTIISAISKIYFIIVSFLLFIFLTLSVTFIILQNGIYIDTLSFQNIKIKQLYIKWNEKLDVSIKETNITQGKKKNNSNSDFKKIIGYSKYLNSLSNLFERIEISKINLDGSSTSLKYIKDDNNFLVISSDSFLLKSSISSNSKEFNIKINNLQDLKRNIKVDGLITLNTKKQELSSSLKIDINSDALIKVDIVADKDRLSYKASSLKDIKSIKYIINMLALDKELNYWILDAIDMSSLSIKSASGWIEYDKLSSAYKNINIEAAVNKLNYRYNPKLDTIHTKKTELEFRNGVLYIRPRNAYTYGFFLDRSWLKIDFTKKDELLTLHLLFKGKVNKDILYLLNTYNIVLPFLQNSGRVDTNLKLDVNLRTIAVKANGKFYTKKANFTYLGLDLDIFKAHIVLNNYDVNIKNMLAKYKDIATANVDVKFDAKNSIGTLGFKVKKVEFKDINLSLKKQKKPLHVTYNISPNKDTININPSIWKYKDIPIKINSMNIPFDLHKLVANIPKTLVEIPKKVSAKVSGKAFLKLNRANLNIDIFKLSQNGIKLSQSNIPLKLTYNKKASIKSDKKIKFKLNNLNCILNETKIDIENEILHVKKSSLHIEDIANSEFNGEYNLNTQTGLFNLKNLNINYSDKGNLITSKEGVDLEIDLSKKNKKIKSNTLDSEYTLTDKGWVLKLNSLENISAHSKILQEYHLTDGDFTISKKNVDENVSFFGNISYPYKILIEDEKPVEEYVLKGSLNTQSKKSILNINNSVDIKIGEEININTQNSGVNINEILNFINDRNSTSNSSNSSTSKNIILSSKDSYLYISKNRHVISQSIDLQYIDEVLTAELKHKDGVSKFRYHDDNFNLYGEDFNDEFMENLFALSKFKGGKLNFSMNGTTKEYDGIFFIEKTTIIDYKILNNILAFVNTIPSLITFSIPGYSSTGLKVKNAYMSFTAKNDIFNISDVYLDSKEMDILGRGTASFKTNNIDLELNLKTDLGSNLSKIPLVGYILLGKDTISTTLSITKDLDNPKIEPLIARDIIVAPLNIIQRTLMLPYELLKDLENKD